MTISPRVSLVEARYEIDGCAGYFVTCLRMVPEAPDRKHSMTGRVGLQAGVVGGTEAELEVAELHER